MLAPLGEKICFLQIEAWCPFYYFTCVKSDIITLHSHKSIIFKEIHFLKSWIWNISASNRSVWFNEKTQRRNNRKKTTSDSFCDFVWSKSWKFLIALMWRHMVILWLSLWRHSGGYSQALIFLAKIGHLQPAQRMMSLQLSKQLIEQIQLWSLDKNVTINTFSILQVLIC